VDANIEGILNLMQGPHAPSDTWTTRAVRNVSRNLDLLRSPQGYSNLDRYKRAVTDLNRLLEVSAIGHRARLSLSNYQHQELSPVRSADLLLAAEKPEQNPFYPYFKRRLPDLLLKGQPSIVGFSLNFLNQALCTFAMIGFLRKECPGLTLVLGGGLMTSWMRRPGWKNPFAGLVEHVIAGPGEGPLLSLAGVKAAGKGHWTPEYGSMPTSDYMAPSLILPYSASGGCYWNKCSFCPERTEGNPYTPVHVDTVSDDLRKMAAATKPSLIHLLDNAVSPRLMKALANNPPGAPWYGFARITRNLADRDFCMALKRSGCVMLKLGLESGSQDVLDRMNKGTDLEVASKSLAALKQAGISTYVYLLFGTPEETENEARKTLEFTVRHAASIDFLNLAIFNLPVYGPETWELETQTHYKGDLSLYTGFTHPRGWNRGLVRQFLDKEFKRSPVVGSILRREPPLFTSNHGPLFAINSSRPYSEQSGLHSCGAAK
jgi:radical SAM superfamily enzyme YgiQ (UPF0313 family)